MMQKRRIAIAVGAAVLVAGVVAGRERPTIDLVENRVAVVQAADDGINLEKLRRNEATLPLNDPFAARNFAPRQEPRPVQEAKPTAPPLPFKYFGRLTEGGKTETFVMQGDDLISIAAGQKIGEYRVDQISEASIAFTYLPLKTKQTLNLE
ncbi:MAG TPA: hypothetical protein VF280_08130 [Burkholderiales bacterium]